LLKLYLEKNYWTSGDNSSPKKANRVLLHYTKFYSMKFKFFSLSLLFLFTVPSNVWCQHNVVWEDIVGLSVSGNSITKTTATTWGNAGAASNQVLLANTDGWLEIEVTNLTGTRTVGFSSSNTDAGKNNIHFGLHLRNNGSLYIKESNTNVKTNLSYAVGNILRIERTGTTITYKNNGQTIYTSGKSSTSTLLVDAAILTSGASISNAIVSFNTTGDDVVHPNSCSDNIDVTWINSAGVSVSGNSLTKTAASGWGNAGAGSDQILLAGEDGCLSTTITSTVGIRTLGFSPSNTDNDKTSVHFSLHLRNGGSLYIKESNANVKTGLTYSIGDLLSIERTGSTIDYKKNGTTIYTSGKSSSTDLIVDAAINNSGSKISNAKVSFSTSGGGDDGGGDDGGNTTSVWTDNSSHISYNGNVLIGTSNTTLPAGYNLYVTEGILAEKAKIALKNTSSWADYVFEKNYILNSLDEVEKFIQQNKHLPNVPSAVEVKKEGIDVAKMDATLLRQIEELWLHLIALKKENQQLQQQITEFSKK